MLVTFLLSTIIVYMVNGISLHCGVDSNLCLGQNVALYCKVTSNYLEWYIPKYKYELDFSVLDHNGTSESTNGLTAFLIENIEGEMLISSIEFVIKDLDYNNTGIICGDGYYSYDNCTITLAETPKISNVKQYPKKHGSLSLSWEQLVPFTGGVNMTYYHITVTPQFDFETCINGSCFLNTTDNAITFEELKCQTYNITITPIDNCTGAGSPISISTNSGLPGKVSGLNMVTFIGNRSVLIKWNMVLDNGGEEISYYKIGLLSESSSKFWITYNTSITINSIEYEDFNLSVRAANCHGEGLPIYINVKLPSANKQLVMISFIFLICLIVVICIVVFIAPVVVFSCQLKKVKRINTDRKCESTSLINN